MEHNKINGEEMIEESINNDLKIIQSLRNVLINNLIILFIISLYIYSTTHNTVLTITLLIVVASNLAFVYYANKNIKLKRSKNLIIKQLCNDMQNKEKSE